VILLVVCICNNFESVKLVVSLLYIYHDKVEVSSAVMGKYMWYYSKTGNFVCGIIKMADGNIVNSPFDHNERERGNSFVII
jgi:hypothetical protein